MRRLPSFGPEGITEAVVAGIGDMAKQEVESPDGRRASGEKGPPNHFRMMVLERRQKMPRVLKSVGIAGIRLISPWVFRERPRRFKSLRRD